MEVETVLMRTDPFRDLDRLTQQMLGTTARPTLMAMDAWRAEDKFVVEFDLPGIEVNSIDLEIERNMLTVRADRPPREGTDTRHVVALSSIPVQAWSCRSRRVRPASRLVHRPRREAASAGAA